MKKLAIGCAVVLVVVGAAAVGVTYYGYLKVKSMATQFAELGQVADLESHVKIKTPFTAPESGELTATQVDRLIQVQTRVRQSLGTEFAAIERNYQTLLNKKQADVTDLPALVGAYKDMAHALVDAKKAQVDALNDLGMSIGEYRWIRAETYHSLGTPFVDLDFAQLAERQRNGQTAGTLSLNANMTGAPPTANAKLVEKYRKQLEDYMPLASFGL